MASAVIEEAVRIPAWVSDLASFRRWAHSDEFPERVRIRFLGGDIWVDPSMEQLYTHNRVKSCFAAVLGALADAENLGQYFSDGILLSNAKATLSTVPDGIFVSFAALRSGSVRRIVGREGGFTELEGSPQMVLEVVSTSSAHADTEVMPDLYRRAHVAEYWLVDARGPEVVFGIFRRGPKGYSAVRRQAGGWLKSQVFGRSFRLVRTTDPVGDPRFSLEVRA